MQRRTKLEICGIVFGVVMVCLAPTGKSFFDAVWYAQHRRKVTDLIETLENRRPAHVAPEVWDVAFGWTLTAYANVSSSNETMRLSELERFYVDLKEELQGDVDLDTLDWIWRRLASTGTSGAYYFSKFEPQYRGHVAGAEERNREKKKP